MLQYLAPSSVVVVEGCDAKGTILRLPEGDVEVVVGEQAY